MRATGKRTWSLTLSRAAPLLLPCMCVISARASVEYVKRVCNMLRETVCVCVRACVCACVCVRACACVTPKETPRKIAPGRARGEPVYAALIAHCLFRTHSEFVI